MIAGTYMIRNKVYDFLRSVTKGLNYPGLPKGLRYLVDRILLIGVVLSIS